MPYHLSTASLLFDIVSEYGSVSLRLVHAHVHYVATVSDTTNVQLIGSLYVLTPNTTPSCIGQTTYLQLAVFSNHLFC
jgi:hypothetical protein